MATNNRSRERKKLREQARQLKLANMLDSFRRGKPNAEERRNHYVGSGQQYTKPQYQN